MLITCINFLPLSINILNRQTNKLDKTELWNRIMKHVAENWIMGEFVIFINIIKVQVQEVQVIL